MADEKIIARFTADISEYKAKLVELENQLNKVNDEQKKGVDEQKKASAELATASQKRKAALQNEEAELKRLQAALKQAFTVKDIETFNKKIAQSKANISVLKGEVGGIGKIAGGLGSQFAALGAGIAAAFTVQAVVAFGKASLEAFREAEVNANKLKFAVTQIGNDGEQSFERLIKQSERLQKISIFSDDDIQRAQTQLIQFGLTADQVELLIPKVLDLASATGMDLAGATDVLIQGINGQTRALKPLGLEFKNTGDKAENLAKISEKLNKFMGSTSVALETSAGNAANFANQVDELQEKIGELINRTGAIQGLTTFFSTIIDSFQTASERAQQQQDNFLRSRIESFQALNKAGRMDMIAELNEEIAFEKKRLSSAKDTNTIEAARVKFKIANLLKERTELERIILLEQGRGKNNLGLTEEEQIRRKAAADAAAEKAAKERLRLDAELKKKGEQIIADIEKKQKAQADKDIKNAQDSANFIAETWQKEVDDKEKAEKDKTKAEKDAAEERKKTAEQEAEEKKKINDAVIQASLQVAGEIADAIFQTQRDSLRRQQEAETQALEQQKDKALRSKRLTDAERDKLNKEFAAKELALKKKQFEQTKKLSLSEAIIKGALAVVNALASSGPPYNYILAAAVAAATAVEIATISSQKFAKGTKKAKAGMALVGEEGPEFMYVPGQSKILTAKQTRQHSGIIDAIYDNRLEKLIYQDHVLPALEKQKQDFAKRRDQSFADNLSRSLIFQGLTGKEMDKIRRKGTAITNTDELAEKIAAIISKGIDRRRMI